MSDRVNIMVSYKRKNQPVAEELCNELKNAGLSPWIDSGGGIEEGKPWREELLKELRSCKAFVALLTPDYVRSEHCRMEVFIARSRDDCPVLPVMVENCYELLDKYEETKGLADILFARLSEQRVVGLPITREEVVRRLTDAARTLGQKPPNKAVYVAYCNKEAALATRIARLLEEGGSSAWVATQDCRVGDNWRQAQARAIMNASIQVVVMDERVVDSQVLRTELLLAEAFGKKVFPVLGRQLTDDEEAAGTLMERLRSADITFGRLAAIHAFRCSEQSLGRLANLIRSELSQQTS